MKKERQETDQEALFEAILALRTADECYAFFKDLCTYQELNAMAQRLQVAKMLHNGHVFHDIVEETGASTATISRVNRAIKDGCNGYQIIFDRIQNETERNDL
ncbi:MAG: YerC/YecD family TrpR-related protein [Ruminococcus sp.]